MPRTRRSRRRPVRRLDRLLALSLGALTGCFGCAGAEAEQRHGFPGDGGGSPDAAQGGNGGAPPASGMSGTISGTVQGTDFSKIGSAWWIGKPAAGSLPVMIFVSDVSLTCATLSAEGWDKAIGDGQLLEMAVSSTSAAEYRVGTEADANYVQGAYNPTADGATVTIRTVSPMRNVTGSFDLTFAGDTLQGDFDAAWCAEGVEP